MEYRGKKYELPIPGVSIRVQSESYAFGESIISDSDKWLPDNLETIAEEIEAGKAKASVRLWGSTSGEAGGPFWGLLDEDVSTKLAPVTMPEENSEN